jgi:hypothetical protein
MAVEGWGDTGATRPRSAVLTLPRRYWRVYPGCVAMGVGVRWRHSDGICWRAGFACSRRCSRHPPSHKTPNRFFSSSLKSSYCEQVRKEGEARGEFTATRSMLSQDGSAFYMTAQRLFHPDPCHSRPNHDGECRRCL